MLNNLSRLIRHRNVLVVILVVSFVVDSGEVVTTVVVSSDVVGALVSVSSSEVLTRVVVFSTVVVPAVVSLKEQMKTVP